jgi:hypothetical protein
MSAWRWLQLMGLTQHTDSFEAEGYDTAQYHTMHHTLY